MRLGSGPPFIYFAHLIAIFEELRASSLWNFEGHRRSFRKRSRARQSIRVGGLLWQTSTGLARPQNIRVVFDCAWVVILGPSLSV